MFGQGWQPRRACVPVCPQDGALATPGSAPSQSPSRASCPPDPAVPAGPSSGALDAALSRLQSCHLSDWPAPLSTAQKCPLPAPSSLSRSAFHLGLSSNRRKGRYQRPAERRCVAMWLGVTLDLFPESTPFRPGTQGDRQLPQERCCHRAARSTSRWLLAP